jgi:hypothetical protein
MRARVGHGAWSRYAHGCRCDACRVSWRAYKWAYQHARRLLGLCVRCGEASTSYRCAPCQAKQREAQRRWRASHREVAA